MIVAESLSKRYAGRAVLDGLSARLAAGEVAALIGPSGAGKSTLLRCINGLEQFDEGTLTVAGEALRPARSRADARAQKRSLLRVRRRVGFVFQQFNLFAHRSA